MSNLPNWSHFSRPQHVGTRSFVFGLLAGFALGLLPWERAVEWAAGRFDLAHARHEERQVFSPQLALARKLNLSYETVAADALSYAGKPVAWCVDHPSRGVSWHSGRPAEPLVWSNDESVPMNSPHNGGKCTDVLAVIEGAGPLGVKLRFVGLP